MTTNTPPEIKSIADAVQQGVTLANTQGAPPSPPADSEEGETPNDAPTSDNSVDSAETEDVSASEPSGDSSSDAGSAPGSNDEGTDTTGGKADSDDTGGDVAESDDEKAESSDPNAAKKVEKPGEKKPDPLTDPIPNALKPATKERIRTLVERTKTAEASLAAIKSERDELIKAVTDTGASPEQYAGMLDYLELINSKDTNKLRAAANFMIRELSAISRIGGFRIPGITSYAGHKDLEEAVASGKLTQELAEEIAAGRAAQAHQGKVGAAQQQMSEARRRYAAADAKARQDMTAQEQEYMRADPLYAQKKPLIVEMLNAMIAGDPKAGVPPLHPAKWLAAYQKIYATLPKTLGGMKPSVKPGAGQPQPGSKVPQNQPLRAQQPAGAQRKEPKSVAEAIAMGVELARGG